MNDEINTKEENFIIDLPNELDGIKFQTGYYYRVDKRKLDSYFLDREYNRDYKSIVILLNFITFNTTRRIEIMADFFTDIQPIGISGRLVAVNDKIENSEKAKELFLKKLHEIIPGLNLELDIDLLYQRQKKLVDLIKKSESELSMIKSIIENSNKNKS